MAGQAVGSTRERDRQFERDFLVHAGYEAASKGVEGEVICPPTLQQIEDYSRLLNNPGTIMPHGVFMLVDESNELRVTAVSNNTEKFFCRSHKDILGTCLLEHFVEKERIQEALAMQDLSLANPVTLSITKLIENDVPGSANLILHRCFPISSRKICF